MGLERKVFLSFCWYGEPPQSGQAGLAGWLGLRRPCPKSGQASRAEPRRGALSFARSDPCLVSQQGLARYTSDTQTKKTQTNVQVSNKY